MKNKIVTKNIGALTVTIAFAGALAMGPFARAEDDMMGSMPQQQPSQPSDTMPTDTSDTSDVDHDHDQMKKDHNQMAKDHKKMKKDAKAMKGSDKNQMQNMGKKKQMPMNNSGSGNSGSGMDHM